MPIQMEKMNKMNSQFSVRFYKPLCFALILLLFIVFSSGLACSPKPVTSPSSSSAIRYGNTVGNISNEGLVAQQGDWIYYSNILDERKLYKIRTDGTQKQLLSDDRSWYLNIADDWIYYIVGGGGGSLTRLSYCKIRTDGTDGQLIGTTEDE